MTEHSLLSRLSPVRLSLSPLSQPRCFRARLRPWMTGLVLVAMLSAPALAQGQPDGDQDTEAGADAAAEPPAPPAPEGAESQDINALRQEYLRLRDQLFRSRARAAAVASAMYSTKLHVDLRYESGRFYSITRATIRLDGANVYDDTSGAIATDPAPRFEGFVAPGRHVLSIRIEATGKDDERFTSIMEHTLAIQAPAGKDVTITARARDNGDIPYSWQKKERGSYKLSLDVKVDTQARAAAPKTSARRIPRNNAVATRAVRPSKAPARKARR